MLSQRIRAWLTSTEVGASVGLLIAAGVSVGRARGSDEIIDAERPLGLVSERVALNEGLIVLLFKK
jgi:hypothetical protein